MPLTEQHKGERENNSVSYDHEPSFSEEGGDGDDLSMDGGSRRKFAALQRKSKWKFVSEVLFERGYHVSPQLCEDKFNDLNKRFKKLNENRLNMHHDLALQHSVKLAFRNIDDQESDDFRNHQLERRTNRRKKDNIQYLICLLFWAFWLIRPEHYLIFEQSRIYFATIVIRLTHLGFSPFFSSIMNVLILSAFGFDAVHMVEIFYKALKFKRFSKASLYLDLRVSLAFKTSKKKVMFLFYLSLHVPILVILNPFYLQYHSNLFPFKY
ncbi:unnamed protein product [Brassica napus]|uniref:(rape) hypothetical protein n=1 Tax=Brassica napus TaxID=3708 RepID=A0A816KIL4_BRANA|nr:unnamed protein product [Brassica napus]